MKQLRHLFTFAIIAAMLVGSFDASAKTKRSKRGRSKAKTSKTTKTSKTSNENEYDLEFFQIVVELANTQCPMDLEDGLVMKSITMEGTKMYYNAVVSDDEMIEMMRDYPDLFSGVMKKELLKGLRDDAFDDDEMLDAMIKLGITVNCRFYAEGESSPILIIPMTAKELKNV